MDIHAQITNQIVAAIEKSNGPGEWKAPWHRSSGNIMRPVNVASKKAYRGVNVLSLWASADEKGYQSGLWGTYKQWQEAGAQVRKGEKSSLIVFYKELNYKNEADEDEKRLMARASWVFSAEQVDGYELPKSLETKPEDRADEIIEVERFIAATGALIVHGGDRAFYRRATDTIHLPPREAFRPTETSTAAEGYYSTKLHELVHWSGIEGRCNREFGKRFGDQAYAMEELVAELGAAFLCGDLNITNAPRLDHAQYLDNWLKVLKSDPKAIFTAASKASQAAQWIEAITAEPEPPNRTFTCNPSTHTP